MSVPTSVRRFLLSCENTLGWQCWTLPDGRVDEMAMRRESAIVKRVIAKNPELYTLKNLAAAVELCRRKRIEINHWSDVFGHVKEALEVVRDDTPLTDVGAQRQAAIADEMARDDDQSDYWIGRLTRAQGPGLLVALTAWRNCRTPESARK